MINYVKLHVNHEAINKSPKKLNAAEIKLTWWFVEKWENLLQGKNPIGWINNQAVTSIRNLITTLAYPKIPTYCWTFASIPNWTWCCSSLLSFVAQISNLWLTPLHRSQYVTNSNNLNNCCWLQSFSLHQKWRLGSTWLQNPKAYKCSSFTQSIWVLNLCFSCMMTFKLSLIYD